MNLKELVLKLRVNHNLKGRYPIVIFTIPNDGGIYSGKKKYYVLTYRKENNDLYFHSLKGIFHKYDMKNDFSLKIDKFRAYTTEFMKFGGGKVSLISYKNDYFPFGFFTGTRDSHEGEVNLEYMLEELSKQGIKYINANEAELKKGKTTNDKIEQTNDGEGEKGTDK